MAEEKKEPWLNYLALIISSMAFFSSSNKVLELTFFPMICQMAHGFTPSMGAKESETHLLEYDPSRIVKTRAYPQSAIL